MLILLAVLAGVARAERVAPPAGFDVTLRGSTASVSYSVMRGESPNAVERGIVEHTCAMKREIGATHATPVFEGAADRPVSITIAQFVSPTAWASYETIQGTVCDPSTMDASRDLCSCTFRAMTSRYVHIRKAAGGATEVIDADLAKGTATRRVRNSPYHAEGGAPDAEAFGPVVGHDVIAGLPCSIRRRDAGAGRTELCLADHSELVARRQWDSELAKSVYALSGGAPTLRDWRRVERIVPDADVDTGVFDVPAGLAIKGPVAAAGASR